MKFKIMIYVYFALSLGLFIYATYGADATTTHVRITGAFYIEMAKIKKDYTDNEIDDMIAAVTVAKNDAVKVDNKLGNIEESSKVDTVDEKGKAISDTQPSEDVKFIEIDLAIPVGKDEKDPVFDEARKKIAILNQYHVPASDKYRITYNRPAYHICNNAKMTACGMVIEIK